MIGCDRLISVDERRRLEFTNKRPVLDPSTEKFQRASELKWMDKNNYWPSNAKVAGQLIESLMKQHFDCGLLRDINQDGIFDKIDIKSMLGQISMVSEH